MSTKRALIVDDSRSARHILGRMLESFGLEVDSVESAELALTFLQTARPDVIFMDHLMPGMDGFAAVRVIKANPDTATIPVLMYTSQEGELYLSQARALGAMGVLPKTLKHSDVADALQHLNLHTPVPSAAPITTRAAARAEPQVEVLAAQVPEPVTAPPESPTSSSGASSVPPLSVQQWAHRIATEVHAEMQRRQPPPDSGQAWRIWALLASGLALLLLGVVIYQQSQIQQQLQQLQGLRPETVAAPITPIQVPMQPVEAALKPLPAGTSASAIGPVVPEMEEFAYGEVPLSGARLERLRTLVDKLRDQRSKGVVRVEVFLGDFCLTGNAASGYVVPQDDLLASRCDITGNPFGDALTVQQRQSVSFANLVASINSNVASGIKVQLLDGAHKALASYPTPSATLTAGAWNRIAERNQRVEFTVLAES